MLSSFRLSIWVLVLCGPALGAAAAEAKSTAAKPTETAKPADIAVRVAVDPRVELLSIIFHLTGAPEYNRARVDSYAADVDKHFGSLRDHRAVALASSLLQQRGIVLDACMNLAVHITDANTLQLRMPLQPWPESLDARWPAELSIFLDAARQFAAESRLNDFLRDHRALYETTESRLGELIRTQTHLEWFADFFGEHRAAGFQVIPALLNGRSSFGPHYRGPLGVEEIYCILGVGQTDQQGNPVFPTEVVGTIVHEFCHSYANQLIDRHAKELQAPAEKLFRLVQVDMGLQSYGHWKSMLYETLVRASVIRYLERYDYENVVWQTMRYEKACGFLWIKELSVLLGDYEKNRKEYPTLDAFFPQIVKFFRDYADKAAAEDAALTSRRPHVLTIDPPVGASNVSPALTEICITFDRLMNISSWTMIGGGPHFPKPTSRPHYDLDRTTLRIPVKLKPDWSYEFLLNSSTQLGIQALDGTPLEPVRVHFRTAKE